MNLLEHRALADKLFADIRALSFDGVGVTRESYGRGENAACDYLRDFALAQGLAVEADAAANLVIRDPDVDAAAPAVWIGSHIDSVPQGGNFDGLAGIVCGLLCVLARRKAGGGKSPPVRTIAFRGEESAWFGKAYMGSGALLGKLEAADLELRQRSTGQTLGECMAAAGADVERIRRQEVLFDKSKVRAYLELHIEQGPVMVAREWPLAVVSGIRGNVRHNRIECVGDAQHSGVVPRWLRHDAVFAVSDLIMRLDQHWRELLERGTDLVVTAGIMQTDAAEHSISRIPGHVAFSLEARSKSIDSLEGFYQLAQAEMAAVARERGVAFRPDRRLLSAPATMDAHIAGLLDAACAALNVPHDVLPSGAGHDASLFANAGIPSGMLFVRNQNGSHNPNEAMDMGDFMLGVQAMSDAIERLSQEPAAVPAAGRP
ncbi:hydantoinase/carbamoylase family amidase [Variovorax sp.]|uniref:hydantoinase/carbamoylase family amidase n=1 Tax=Variovorax sp. TaxID=1871043 RepID=UPI002D5835F4|nr:hydantoinase/carbamoylase family amidase [Variovorax sp.]HYP85204.1 hydantoinase/carbamoylase family amidase [Variovorax sp.]